MFEKVIIVEQEVFTIKVVKYSGKPGISYQARVTYEKEEIRVFNIADEDIEYLVKIAEEFCESYTKAIPETVTEKLLELGFKQIEEDNV